MPNERGWWFRTGAPSAFSFRAFALWLRTLAFSFCAFALSFGCSGARGTLAEPDAVQPKSDADAAALGREERVPAGGAEVAPPSGKSVELDLTFEGSSARVLVPEGAGPHPVFFVTHGAGGDADDDCKYWGEFLGPEVALVCLRGAPLYRKEPWRGWYYPDHLALEEWTLAAVVEVKARLGARVAASGWTYAGYSQGATMGALMLVNHGGQFSRAIFVEGGVGGWTYARVTRYRESGGERVLFVCGTRGCANGAGRAARELEEAGVPARALVAEGAGHAFDGALWRELAVGLGWLRE